MEVLNNSQIWVRDLKGNKIHCFDILESSDNKFVIKGPIDKIIDPLNLTYRRPYGQVWTPCCIKDGCLYW